MIVIFKQEDFFPIWKVFKIFLCCQIKHKLEMCNFPSHLFFSSRFYYSNRTVFVLFEKILKKILTLQYDTFCRNRKTFCNAFRIYSKSQTRKFFATLKNFLQENFTMRSCRIPEHRRSKNVLIWSTTKHWRNSIETSKWYSICDK